MSEEEIFNLPTEKPKPTRKKKTLSEAQLAALAKGRAKMALKRAEKKAQSTGKSKEELKAEKDAEKLAKEKEKEAKELAKLNKKGEQENVKQSKKNLKSARKSKKEQEALAKVMKREKDQKAVDRYYEVYTDILGRCTNVHVYNQVKEALEDITEDEMCDEGKLHAKLMAKLSRAETEETKRLQMANDSSIKEI